MIIIEVIENSTIVLPDEQCAIARKLIEEHPDLPLRLENNSISTSEYIVGEVLIGDYLIRFKPRNEAIDLSTIFEMLLYISSDSLSKSISSSSYVSNRGFGLSTIHLNFVELCNNLIGFGLTGEFNSKESYSKNIKGKIVESKFVKQLIPFKGIYSFTNEYSLDIEANRIIKLALEKLLKVVDSGLQSDLFAILRSFENINIFAGSHEELDSIKRKFYSSNPFYPIVLEYAIKIIKDLKLNYRNGNINYYSFLENSNSVFEEYVRAILTRGLKNSVTKWVVPVKFGEIAFGNKSYDKNYVPDIVIDQSNDSCRAIFDVKNKDFNPIKYPIHKLVSHADIYQMHFYANMLSPKICGLIYPTVVELEPIELFMKSSRYRLFIIGLNMNENFWKRKENLIEKISKQVLIYS